MSAAVEQRNQDATCYCGNLDEKCTEELLWELMLQCGPVVNVHMPRDKVTGNHQGYGFVEFRVEEDAEYTIKVRSGVPARAPRARRGARAARRSRPHRARPSALLGLTLPPRASPPR